MLHTHTLACKYKWHCWCYVRRFWRRASYRSPPWPSSSPDSRCPHHRWSVGGEAPAAATAAGQFRWCAAAGSHAGKSAGKPSPDSWERKRRRGGRTGQTGGVQATGTFSDLWIHTRTNVLLPGNTLRGPGAPRCLIPVLEPVSSSR